MFNHRFMLVLGESSKLFVTMAVAYPRSRAYPNCIANCIAQRYPDLYENP
jgi:hypothetical protein